MNKMIENYICEKQVSITNKCSKYQLAQTSCTSTYCFYKFPPS